MAAAPAAAGTGVPSALEGLGVQRTKNGHNFSLFAPAAKRVQLLVNGASPSAPFTEPFALDSRESDPEQKGFWQREVVGLPDSFEYAYRLDGGPLLLDPYARCLSGGELWADRSWEVRGLPFRPYRGFHSAAFESTLAPGAGRPPRPKVADSARVIYELHLRGFTRHPSSGVTHPGTYLGLIEKIPYLVDLGVTTVELLPLLEFDETENRRRNPATGERLVNFWGYSPVSYFAPKASYAASPTPGAAHAELVAMIDALHAAGLEVIVDVVYNHTAEGGGGATDPLHSFRGLAPSVYYIQEASGRAIDVTGCGNTVNTNHPLVRRMILDSLRFWAEEIGVDGFRFDLAAAFFRGLQGEKLAISPIATEIAADPVLAGRLLIAEPWDVTGFSPGDGFPAPWQVWNGAFRDDARRYLRGDEVAPSLLARRFASSTAAVDFLTCHDGFTLLDLLSYSEKHNAENGEASRDGSSFNLSSNHGVEGETGDPAVRELRGRQVRNALALLLLSHGTPMLLAGDERGRTQRGNNNAWCQDNAVSWIDWEATTGEGDILRRLIALRHELATLSFAEWSEIAPFQRPGHPASSARPALLLTRDEAGERTLLVALNPSTGVARFPLPRASGSRPWALVLDTQADAYRGVAPSAGVSHRPQFAAETSEIEVQPRSIRILLS
ncbi:MAG: alpha-amylase family glycosyl hydrolase [Thermoanaerobaculia bacterium]